MDRNAKISLCIHNVIFGIAAGNVTDQMIKAYIEKHEGKNDAVGDFQVEN